jgi:protein-disulfide isomerase
LPAEPLALDGAETLGSRTAHVAILEYTDMQCPYCARFSKDTLPVLRRDYIDTGKVLFVLRPYPLEEIHSFALQAAEAAACAGRQGQFWKVHDLMFADQRHLDADSLRAMMKTLGLNLSQYDVCLSGDVKSIIQRDKASGKDLTIAGTPSFFIGVVQANGRLKVTKRLSGALPAGQFKEVVDGLLRTQ